MDKPIVFISYSHDNDGHTERVRRLDASLRQDGCACRLDFYKDTKEDWPTWMKRQLIEADAVLCVVTPTYAQRFDDQGFDDQKQPATGLGVGWEARLIRNLLYSKKLHNGRIFPVFFHASDQEHIPLELQGYDYFCLDGPEGYKSLLRKLLDCPPYKQPPPGPAPDLPSQATDPLFLRPQPIVSSRLVTLIALSFVGLGLLSVGYLNSSGEHLQHTITKSQDEMGILDQDTPPDPISTKKTRVSNTTSIQDEPLSTLTVEKTRNGMPEPIPTLIGTP